MKNLMVMYFLLFSCSTLAGNREHLRELKQDTFCWVAADLTNRKTSYYWRLIIADLENLNAGEELFHQVQDTAVTQFLFQTNQKLEDSNYMIKEMKAREQVWQDNNCGAL
ncbi:TPA: hypothetical protein RQJ43_004599 [Vibrio vulnificus]|nr:hypothetical protein [Vibrio vulnificus]